VLTIEIDLVGADDAHQPLCSKGLTS
jgi:hypothetical protein